MRQADRRAGFIAFLAPGAGTAKCLDPAFRQQLLIRKSPIVRHSTGLYMPGTPLAQYPLQCSKPTQFFSEVAQCLSSIQEMCFSNHHIADS